jgi:hypothetical protein
VLTGAAFGIVFLYLLDAGQQAFAGQRQRSGGPMEGPADDGLGKFRTSVGRIPISPLEDVAVGLGGAPATGSGQAEPLKGLASGGSGSDPGGGLGFRPDPGGTNLFAATPGNQGGPDANRLIASAEGPPLSDSQQPQIGTNPQPSISPPGPSPTVPDPGPDPIGSKDLPKLLLVLVRVTSESTSRSVDGKALSDSIIHQFGVRDSSVNLQNQPVPGLEVRSDLALPGSAYSQLSDAELRVIAQDMGLVNSTVLGGEASDVVVIGVQDLLSLVLATPKSGTLKVDTQSIGVAGGNLQLGDGANVLDLEALQRLSFTAVGPSQQAHLTFNLLTNGIKDSLVAMGAGNDTMLVNSGWYGGELPQDIPLLLNPANLGISLDLNQISNLASHPADFSASLNAVAIGLDHTTVNLGDGNNYMAINTAISQNLASDLGILGNGSATDYQLDRIGMRDSLITMGSGNDTLIVNGRVIDSTINLGGGTNQILLETPLEGTSRIEGDTGTNQITVSRLVGSAVIGGNGDDTLSLKRVDGFGAFDGGGGNNALIGPSGSGSTRDVVVVTGQDQGFYNAISFNHVGTIDTGGNNDVVIMNLGASLTGQLIGGSGLDRLEFHNWTLPVAVDLDRGSATAIANGAPGSLGGFEQVKGSNGNDLLISSGAFNGIDGGEGDDVMYLRWSPWLSAPTDGLQVVGGNGKDLFVFSGLDTPSPASWDGQSGLPTLSDLDLSFDTTLGIGLTDRIGMVQNVTNADGSPSQAFQELMPSNVTGVGNAKLLPIAPLEQLVSGMTDNTKQLAVSFDPLSKNPAELIMLGAHGQGTFENVAHLNVSRLD